MRTQLCVHVFKAIANVVAPMYKYVDGDLLMEFVFCCNTLKMNEDTVQCTCMSISLI